MNDPPDSAALDDVLRQLDPLLAPLTDAADAALVVQVALVHDGEDGGDVGAVGGGGGQQGHSDGAVGLECRGLALF